jgi:hypothetical protein
MLMKEGISSFYKGFGMVVCCTLPAHSLYFCGYELSKKYLKSEKEQSMFSAGWRHFWSGMFADVCGSFIWVPMVFI